MQGGDEEASVSPFSEVMGLVDGRAWIKTQVCDNKIHSLSAPLWAAPSNVPGTK